MTDRGDSEKDVRRADLRASLQRDLRRYDRREPGNRTFWQSLSVLGSVGWPIVMATVGGALAGRWLDARWSTGIRFTLMLLVGGAIVGAAIVWHVIQPRPR